LTARQRDRLPVALLAGVIYLPLLLTHRGMVGADTKTYLYLDPGRLLSRAWSMWDPSVGLGTVTHQNIGYLWPMGPWYWLFEQVGLPDWVAQRLWLGSIMFLAGLGVRFLLHTLGQRGPHVAASMFLYALTPYVLPLGARLSAILLPFAGLPWMIALAVRAGRTQRWREPALFALTVLTIGGTNATGLVLAGLAPLLWFAAAVWVERELSPADALRAIGRIGTLTVLTSLWWIAGLYCQSAFGIAVLRYTETAKVVADDSFAPELLRGLGYWYFYGDDKLGPWIEPSVPYTQQAWLVGITYLIPVLGLLAAALVRWRHRAYFVGLVFLGLLLGVGAHPWGDPPLVGRGIKAFLVSDLGLAMRSLPRAAPLIALGLSVLFGTALAALAREVPRLARPAAAGVVVLALLGLPALWQGDMVANNLQRSEDLPEYWLEAAEFLDGRGDDTRVLELPGADFATYRWGDTVDPITPGLMDRPYVARELIPYGTPAAADLVNAIDRQLQEEVLDPEALAPVARLMGVGDVVLRGDLAYERYHLARPRQTYDLFQRAPGLGPPVGFGGDDANVPDPRLPLIDELELGAEPDLPNPSKVTVFPVEDPEPIVRATPTGQPVIIAGDADGLLSSAGAGLLTGRELVLFSADYADEEAQLRRQIGRDAALVVTDTNRKAARRWSTVLENNGYTEEAGEEPLRTDLTDNRLPVFPDADDDAFTVAQHRGGVHARATGYGNPITYTPDDRAANAVDGDQETAWSTGAFSQVRGERLELTYDEVQTADSITLNQRVEGTQNRWITRIGLRFDDGERLELELDERSRGAPGQTLTFPRRSFRHAEIEVLDDSFGIQKRYTGQSAVGFAEVELGDPDVALDEVTRLPLDLLEVAGTASEANPLALVLTRIRTRPANPLRNDQELSMARVFELPTARSFALSGEARLSADAPDPVLDELLGVSGPDEGGVSAEGSRGLSGDLHARASSAIDGDPTTVWSPGFLNQRGEYLDYELDAPISFDRLDLTLLNDGRHSLPTEITVIADGREAAVVELPELEAPTGEAQAGADELVRVPVDLPEVTGRELRFEVSGVKEVKVIDWHSKGPITAPVGIAELGVPGLSAPPPPDRFDDRCREDLVTVDGEPVGVRVTGAVDEALTGLPLEVELCGPELRLDAGEHVLRTRPGHQGGIDLDRLVLRSAPGGGPDTAGEPLGPPPGEAGDEPEARVVDEGRASVDVEVTGADGEEPFWLVLGQSHSPGWAASQDAGGGDLGEPRLVNGFANGWEVRPDGQATMAFSLRWTPQRFVLAGLALSAIGVVLCLVLALLPRFRRRSARARPVAAADEQPAPLSLREALRYHGSRPPVTAVVVAALGALVVAGAVISPWAGLACAAAAVAGLRSARARPLLVLGSPALLAIAGGYTIVAQLVRHPPPGFEWPQHFAAVHQVGWLAVAFLLLDVVLARIWSGRWWPASGDES
jgi:arabinofuranan 3-O-arabinosyltransferase